VSKIQDALKKIQSRDNPPAKTVIREELSRVKENSESRESPVTKIGHVVDELDATGVRIRPEDGGLITVDRDLLREAGYLAPLDQERSLADQYRLLKRPLLSNAFGKGRAVTEDANLVTVTSALPGDGKTFNCINLALSMAIEKDVSVLLVDADVAKPHISKLFGVENQPGLIDLLKDDSAAVDATIMRTDIPGLRILPAGSADEYATELLASRRMREVVDNLSKSYADRIVLFDSPPLLATSEASVLASLMGQIVVLVCAGKTPRQAVLAALDSLDETKAINLILNQSNSDEGTAAYGSYGYGYGS